jgi:hypothetical protein
MNTPYVSHTFRPGDTIDAVIRLKGRHNLTQAEMIPLREAFNRMNQLGVIRPGMSCKIPLCEDPFSQAEGVESEGGEID